MLTYFILDTLSIVLALYLYDQLWPTYRWAKRIWRKRYKAFRKLTSSHKRARKVARKVRIKSE